MRPQRWIVLLAALLLWANAIFQAVGGRLALTVFMAALAMLYSWCWKIYPNVVDRNK